MSCGSGAGINPGAGHTDRQAWNWRTGRGFRAQETSNYGNCQRNEGSKVNSNINVTPMVDVMLVLLIIFMVITPMLQKGSSVDMAKVNNPESMPDADKEDALLVASCGTVRFTLARDRIKADELTDKVKDRLANRVDKRIFIRADMRAKYGAVVDVVDNVRAAGVDDVGLLTEQKTAKPASSQPPPGAHRRGGSKERSIMAMTVGGPAAAKARTST